MNFIKKLYYKVYRFILRIRYNLKHRNDFVNRAKKEVELVKKNADEYSTACLDSAFRAYKAAVKSMQMDGHSGYSHSVTVNLLEKLLEDKPLSSITDDDFITEDSMQLQGCGYTYCSCPRYHSLYKRVYEDGHITYNDINREVIHDLVSDLDWLGNVKYLKEYIPEITMPYYPERYIVNEYQFTYKDKKCSLIPGEYNCVFVRDIETQNGKVEVNKYYLESGNEFTEIKSNKVLDKFIEDLKNGNQKDYTEMVEE